MNARITTHILNLSSGMPVANLDVTLYEKHNPNTLFTASTNADGRILEWSDPVVGFEGVWVLTFATNNWFSQQGQSCFFDDVILSFKVSDAHRDYHVPLLLNAYGYSTYRGS